MAQTTTLNFNVIGQSLERLDNNKIVEKAKNYVEAQFSFNEVWENTTKAILIEGSNLKYKAYLNEENKCSIPNRVVRHDGFTLTVVGEDSEKFITITTNDLFIPIAKNNAEIDVPKYVEVIESDTLDVTREGEKYNLEIPESYKNCYIVTRNDISDITVLSNDTYSVTLSEEIEQVITDFKQNLYVDWVTEFPELSNTLGIIKLTNCYPSKKINGDEEVPTYYVFSATDSVEDFSMGFFYEDDTWKVTITHGALADREYVSMEVSRLENEIGEKSKVVPNPTLSGDEPDLEGAEIDGIKYKVGGGSKSYLHKISITFSLIAYGNLGNISLLITNSNNTPIGKEFFRNTLGYDTSNNLCYITGFIDNTSSSTSYKDKYIVIGFYITSNWQLGIRLLALSDLSIVNVNSYYSGITDTVTEV